jgi:transcription-repair coupling factor (superfamily II helicase)
MMEFYEKKIDVLVCTTIVESGLDLPNVNTIFINNAHEFGLAQLYQLKGRVGRGNQRAHAYLLHPAGQKLSEISRKRLSIINEFSELGSGIKVAMKDLEIRGAGNIFGTQQHGNILSVGLEMYLKLLETTVAELKGEAAVEDTETNLDLNFEGYIPDTYIPTLKSKFYFYKEIMKCVSLEELAEVEKELTDRFGRMPSTVNSIFLVKKIKILAHSIGIVSVSLLDSEFVLGFSRIQRQESGLVSKMLEFLAKNPPSAHLDPARPNQIRVASHIPGKTELDILHDFLKNLTDYITL